jgi:hypothetical protein
MAFQVGFDLAQAARPAKLRIQHRDQMSPHLQLARITVSTVLRHKPANNLPVNGLQQPWKTIF